MGHVGDRNARSAGVDGMRRDDDHRAGPRRGTRPNGAGLLRQRPVLLPAPAVRRRGREAETHALTAWHACDLRPGRGTDFPLSYRPMGGVRGGTGGARSTVGATDRAGRTGAGRTRTSRAGPRTGGGGQERTGAPLRRSRPESGNASAVGAGIQGRAAPDPGGGAAAGGRRAAGLRGPGAGRGTHRGRRARRPVPGHRRTAGRRHRARALHRAPGTGRTLPAVHRRRRRGTGRPGLAGMPGLPGQAPEQRPGARRVHPRRARVRHRVPLRRRPDAAGPTATVSR